MNYVPAAVATAVSSGAPRPCPQCEEECSTLYGLTGGDGTMVCGRCYDDNAFEGKPELRAEMEKYREDVLVWMLTGKVPGRER